MDPFSWVVESLLKYTLVVRESSRAAVEPYLLADIIVPIKAHLTLVTGHSRLYYHPVSHLELILRLDLQADSYDQPGALVAL
jgi:hypothetical protein